VGELADIGAGDESLVASAGENDTAHRGVVAGILECGAQIGPGRRVQRIEHLRTIERHVGDAASLLVQNIRKR